MRNKYTYVLLSNDSGQRLELANAPQGWDAQRFNVLRDMVYLGVMKSITVEFQFVGDGFTFLQRQKLKYGVDANVVFRLYKRNKFLFEGKVNFENYDEDRKFNRFQVDIIQSAQVQKFNNREDIKYNIFNNISADRLPATPAALKNATIRGRRIEFFTQFDGSVTTEPDIFTTTLPFNLKVNGNQSVNTSSYTIVTPPLTEEAPEQEVRDQLYAEEAAIYVNELVSPQSLDIEFSANITIEYKGEPLPILLFGIGDLVAYLGYKIFYRVAIVDEAGEIIETLYTQSFTDITGTFDLAYSGTVEIPVGGRLVFACERWSRMYFYDDGDLVSTNELEYQLDGGDAGDVVGTRMRTEITYNDLQLKINTPSIVPDTTNPVVLPHELFSALMDQINGGTFTSDIFGRTDLGYYEDGAGAYVAITKGELLRGIDPTTVQLSTSMRDAFKSYSSIFCLGAIITEDGIRIDPLDVLFNSNIALDLGEVNDLHMRPAKDFLYNSVLAGYPVNEYEEENGRDEFNTTYQYTNSLQAVKKELNLVSVYFGDGYGIEFARRQGVLTSGTKDTRYDNQIFFIDLIKVGDELVSRRLEDILFVDGIFSPETAINLNIAVGQNMKRQRKFLNIPLHKKDKKYYFQSKDKNVGLRLVTALGETNDGEDLDMGNQQYFIPEERSFNKAVSVELGIEALMVNPLGLVKYRYKGEKFYDLLYEVDSETDKNKTEWRVLGTRDTPVEINEDLVDGPYVMFGDGHEDHVMYDNEPEDILAYDD